MYDAVVRRVVRAGDGKEGLEVYFPPLEGDWILSPRPRIHMIFKKFFAFFKKESCCAASSLQNFFIFRHDGFLSKVDSKPSLISWNASKITFFACVPTASKSGCSKTNQFCAIYSVCVFLSCYCGFSASKY